jgi:hypothetical protein
LLGALLLGFLPILRAGSGSEVSLNATPTASAPWLSRLNAWRANVGLPSLTENTTWSTGDYDHSLYMVKNDELAHSENPTHPYYTVAGDTAARNSNIQVSSTTSATDSQAIDWWMAAPFHAMSMMDPLLASTGFGSYRQVKSGWQAGFGLDVSRGRLSSGGRYPMFYPGNGTTEPLSTFGGGEYPDPLQACSGYTAPTGLPLFIEVGSNVVTTAGAHSFTGDGVALPHCVIDSRNAALGSNLQWHGAVVLIPKAPLQTGVKYVVSLTVNAKPYTWSFTVGSALLPQLAVTSVSPNNGPLGGGTAVTINGRGFSGGVTGVMFGATPAASFSMVDDSTITAVSPPQAGGTVDVTVTTAGGTTTVSNSDHYTYGACTSAAASASPPSPSTAGSLVTIAGTAAGCTAPLYEFWLQWVNGTWHVVKAFGDATWSWDTSTYAPGTYTIHVWANNTGDSQVAFEVFGTTTYTVLPNVCTSASLGPTNPSAPAGSTVALTASSSGCPNPQYEFWVMYPNQTWHLIQGFGGSIFNWNTNGLAPGTYEVHAWANQQGSSTKSFQVMGATTVTLTGCTAATVSPPSGSVTLGTPVTFSATPTGCTNAVYEPWLQYPDGTWHMMRAFSLSNAWTWTTAGLPKGKYVIHFWANNQGSYSSAFQAFGTSTYTLT